ncbi:PREDICTED: protein EFFECTOR OF TRANSCRIPTION 1-like [Camelina sativa]|uniref:Protein EFFECTOR OF TRANSCRIPTION 1-like n=1 Tax=Camelina sativa TaxID=90675 RepID=A0ABM0TZ74_CAMSA|nr:PREDICTED: protein EFFECTOR OF TRANSCRIPTION 1-like [Camelina sativa]
MFKRDDCIRTNHDAVFSKWQGIARSMLLRKPISQTAELRKTYADYSLISRDLGPKILIGADDKENFRKGKDCVGRYRGVQEALPGLSELGVSVINHDQGRKDDGLLATLGQTESINYRLRSYGRSTAHPDVLKKLGDIPRKSGLSQTILPVTQKKADNKTEENKHDSAEEREFSSDAAEKVSNLLLSPSRPQPVSDRHSHDGIVDGSDSASVCGVLLEDGTTCATTPIKGRKRCTEHKGKKLSRVSPVKLIPSEVPTRRECQETDDICGVILPDMVRCRRPPVLRRKRCEDHKGMRVNAFFFLLNPTERDEAVKEAIKEDKSKPKTCTGMNQEDLLCEATTNNGLPCTRRASKGSKRCWQHKDKTVDHGSSENVQSATISKVICGVKLYSGSVCEKAPVKGRKRCEEHKGMRITS